MQIKLKNSVTQDSTPSTSDLPEVGELAVNGNINSIGGFMRASDNTIVKIFGPGSVTTPTATTTVSGIAELATGSETTTGTATDKIVTPAGLKQVTDAERATSNSAYMTSAGGTLTGALTMPNGSNAAPAINFGDSDSGIFGGTNTVSLAAGGTTRLTADTGVSVVGTLAVTGAITSTSNLTVAHSVIHAGDTDTFFAFPTANVAAINTAGSEKLRVDASGRLLIGTSSPRSPASVTAQIQLEATTQSGSAISLSRNSGNTGGPVLIFNKTRGTSVGANGIVNNGDTLGVIIFAGNDGSDSDNVAAEIISQVDDAPATNTMPGRLVFKTTSTGNNLTERMRIDSAGRVGIGTTSPDVDLHVSGGSSVAEIESTSSSASARLIIKSANDTYTGVHFGDDADEDVGRIRYYHTSDSMQFSTGASERMRIDSSGNVGIGTTSPQTHLTLRAANAQFTLEPTANTQTCRLQFCTSDGTIKTTIQGGGSLDTALRVVQNSGEVLRLDTSGNVGIGTSSPAGELHVSSGTSGDCELIIEADTDNNNEGDNPRILFRQDGGQDFSSIGNGNNELELKNAVASGGGISFSTSSTDGYTNASRRMTISSSGNVMIGTTTPGAANADEFTVAGTSHTGISIRSSTTTSGSIFFSDGTSGDAEFRGYVQYGHNSNYMRFATNAVERIRINSDGQVGIGTSSPSSKLHVVGNITVSGTVDGKNVSTLIANVVEDSSPQLGGNLDMNGELITAGDSTATGVNRIKLGTGNDLQLYHDGSNSRVTSSSGNFFIESVNNDPVYIDGSVIYLRDNDNDIRFKTTSSGAQVERNDSGSDCVLAVFNDANSSSSDSFLRIKVTHSSANSVIQFADSDNDVGEINYDHADNDFTFRMNNSNVYLMNTGAFFPNSNNGPDLGTSSKNWDNVRCDDVVESSDRNAKNTIVGSDLGLDFINKLNPVSYKKNNGKSGRTHYGLISQEVEAVISQVGKTTADFAGFVKDTVTVDDDGNSITPQDYYSLRYREFISPIIKAIQELSAKVTALESA